MRDWWNKIKKAIIALGIVGILLALFFVPSFSRITYEKSLGEQSEYSGDGKFEVLQDVIPKAFENLSIAFTKNFSDYVSALKVFAIAYGLFCVFVIYKILDKKEYENIEHGSADWCSSSEAYSVLSPKEGLVLAEKYYLPIIPEAPSGKNGNVLIIGGSGSRKICILCYT